MRKKQEKEMKKAQKEGKEMNLIVQEEVEVEEKPIIQQ